MSIWWISRLLKIIGLFGEYRSLLQGSFAKETYHFKEPTNRSHPIFTLLLHVNMAHSCEHWVATIRRLLKIIGLFCKRALQKRPVFSKKTHNFEEPTNRSPSIWRIYVQMVRSCEYSAFICTWRMHVKMARSHVRVGVLSERNPNAMELS